MVQLQFTVTATDLNGNSSNCYFNVTINDVELPILTGCPNDIIVSSDNGQCDASVFWQPITPSDNCPGVSLVSSHISGQTFPLGTTEVTYIATDASGNTAQCSFNVTVEDNELPTIIYQDITVQLDINGNVAITPADIDNGSYDNCGIDSLSISISNFNCTNVGLNTINFTVTDVNGNSSTTTANVTVEDNVAPVASCKDITVQLDASGNASITAADIDNRFS